MDTLLMTGTGYVVRLMECKCIVVKLVQMHAIVRILVHTLAIVHTSAVVAAAASVNTKLVVVGSVGCILSLLDFDRGTTFHLPLD